jgi:hypothetical protein
MADDNPLFNVIYPRAWIECVVIFDDGDTTTTGMAPSNVTVSLNPHHQADTCEATVNLSALTFGHRTVTSIFVTVFMGVVNQINDLVYANKTNQVFCGYADVLSDRRSSKGPEITLRCRDLSGLLREQTKLIAKKDDNGVVLDPTPRYSDTVSSAIQRVLQWAQIDDDVLQVSDPYGLGSIKLSQAVSKREQNSYLPIKRDASAWDAIEHVAALASVLVTVDGGNIVLRPPSDLLGEKGGKPQPSAASFIFGFDGANVLEVEREKKFLRNRRGVRVVAFDPISRKSISADYPPDGQLPPNHYSAAKHKKHAKKASASSGSTPAPPDRDIYTFGLEGISSVDQALAIATRLWFERSRQETEGNLVTKNWTPGLFQLRNGSRVSIRVSQRLEQELRNFDDDNRKLEFLRTRLGVDTDAAQMLLRNAAREEENVPYYVRSVHHRWSPKSFQTNVDFINLLVLG